MGSLPVIEACRVSISLPLQDLFHVCALLSGANRPPGFDYSLRELPNLYYYMPVLFSGLPRVEDIYCAVTCTIGVKQILATETEPEEAPEFQYLDQSISFKILVPFLRRPRKLLQPRGNSASSEPVLAFVIIQWQDYRARGPPEPRS